MTKLVRFKVHYTYNWRPSWDIIKNVNTINQRNKKQNDWSQLKTIHRNNRDLHATGKNKRAISIGNIGIIEYAPFLPAWAPLGCSASSFRLLWECAIAWMLYADVAWLLPLLLAVAGGSCWLLTMLLLVLLLQPPA